MNKPSGWLATQPDCRLDYLNSLKDYVRIGEGLYRLSPDEKLKARIDELKVKISNYTLYPKLRLRCLKQKALNLENKKMESESGTK